MVAPSKFRGSDKGAAQSFRGSDKGAAQSFRGSDKGAAQFLRKRSPVTRSGDKMAPVAELKHFNWENETGFLSRASAWSAVLDSRVFKELVGLRCENRRALHDLRCIVSVAGLVYNIASELSEEVRDLREELEQVEVLRKSKPVQAFIVTLNGFIVFVKAKRPEYIPGDESDIANNLLDYIRSIALVTKKLIEECDELHFFRLTDNKILKKFDRFESQQTEQHEFSVFNELAHDYYYRMLDLFKLFQEKTAPIIIIKRQARLATSEEDKKRAIIFAALDFLSRPDAPKKRDAIIQDGSFFFAIASRHIIRPKPTLIIRSPVSSTSSTIKEESESDSDNYSS